MGHEQRRLQKHLSLPASHRIPGSYDHLPDRGPGRPLLRTISSPLRLLPWAGAPHGNHHGAGAEPCHFPRRAIEDRSPEAGQVPAGGSEEVTNRIDLFNLMLGLLTAGRMLVHLSGLDCSRQTSCPSLTFLLLEGYVIKDRLLRRRAHQNKKCVFLSKIVLDYSQAFLANKGLGWGHVPPGPPLPSSCSKFDKVFGE